MSKKRKVIAIDCETDPFLHGRVPQPYIWGAYDGKEFKTWRSTDDFINWLSSQHCYAYAHNGGKFDFLYLMKYARKSKVKIIAGRMAEMSIGNALLRDSYSIIPVPLGAIQKSKINYSLMEADVRERYIESDIIPYLKDDCVFLWQNVDRFRTLAGKQLTIASNAASFARKLKCDLGRTHKLFDDEFRPYYFGGRTQCFQPGTHHNITIIDIVSSYPFAMTHDHATGVDRITDNSPDALEKLSHDEINRAFIDLECYSAGAFPKRQENGSLEFPHEYGLYKITGWEYNVAKKHGLIRDEKILRVVSFENTINFKPYVDHWFELKSTTDKKENPIDYTIAKIMQNSLYGKAAQNPLRYYDYKNEPAGTDVNYDEGWTLFVEFEELEIHRRSREWNYKYKWGREFETKPIYYNVATGASITGFARARLLDAAHMAGIERVIYCDTDSLALHGDDLSAIEMGPELGKWELEGHCEIGHFARKKLYGVKFASSGADPPKYKIASKGAKLTFKDIEDIANGRTVLWKNPAPTYRISEGIVPWDKSIDPERFFIQRRIASKTIEERKAERLRERKQNAEKPNPSQFWRSGPGG